MNMVGYNFFSLHQMVLPLGMHVDISPIVNFVTAIKTKSWKNEENT